MVPKRQVIVRARVAAGYERHPAFCVPLAPLGYLLYTPQINSERTPKGIPSPPSRTGIMGTTDEELKVSMCAYSSGSLILT